MKRSELFFTALLVPVDILAVVLAFSFAYNLRGFEYIKIIIYLLPLWVIFFAFVGLYSARSTRSLSSEFKDIFVAVTAGITSVLALGYIFPNKYIKIALPQPIFPSKFIPLFGWILAIVFVSIGRLLIYRLQKLLFAKNVGVHHALLVGSTKSAMVLEKEINFKRSLGYKIVGTVRDQEAWNSAKTNFKSFGHIDELIVTDMSMQNEFLLDVLAFANRHHLDFKFVPSILGLATSRSSVSAIGSVPLIEVMKTPLEGWGRIFKRIFDLTLSLSAVIIIAPILIIVAILVKLTSPGPIFFSHERVGKGKKIIKVHKFRTMQQDAEKRLEKALQDDAALKKEWEENYKLKKDPRITPLGRFLRKTSLDELPQFFNVISGEMSLVGPRPVLESELAKYGQDETTLLSLKPGITGLWQISGRSDLSYEERVKLDILYIENWNPWLDIYILLKTIPSLIKGAY